MSGSPNCEVREGAGSFVATSGGVNVLAGAALSIRLADATDVDQWFLEVLGTDELSSEPTLIGVDGGTHLVTSPSTVVTLTFPNAIGRAVGFKSTIVSGIITIVAKFAVYTLILGNFRVGFAGETEESSAVFGWTGKLNGFLRSAVLDLDTPFSATLSGGTIVEVSQSVVTPAFTAAYTTSPVSVTLTDDAGSSPKDVSGTPTSFTSNGTFTKNSYGGTVVFTVTAVKTYSRVATTTTTWGQKVYWGVRSDTGPGPYNAGFITGLSTSSVTTTRSRTVNLTAGSGQYHFYALRTAYGTPTFSVDGLSGGFTKVATGVSVTNGFGFAEGYDLWRSNQANLGDTNIVIV